MRILLIHFKVLLFLLIEESKVICRYYKTLPFLRVDLALMFFYLFRTPYKISKKYAQVYGETPLTTLDKIVREANLFSHDVIFDLGCGRGRTTFWLATHVGCRSYGVEIIPEFIQRASRIKKWERFQRALFVCEDMLKVDFLEATAIYLYGITFEEEMMEQLIAKFSMLKEGTKIITVSEPLPDIAPFKLIKEFEGRFPWGKTSLFLHTIVRADSRDLSPAAFSAA